MTIQSTIEIEALERNIGEMLRSHTLEGVLLGLRQAPPRVKSFMIAGTALFAVRYCLPGLKSMVKATRWSELSLVVHQVTQYLLTDPAPFAIHTTPVGTSMLSILLRTVGRQFPFERNNRNSPGLWLTMYEDLPKELAADKNTQKFDFDAKFKALYTVSVGDFIRVCLTADAGTHANARMTRRYFEKARQDGVQLPDDATVVRVLEQIAATPSKLIQMYEEYRQTDRHFAAYDYNPLLNYPIIRPWEQTNSIDMDEDCFTAPLPHLIESRVSAGIYTQMRHRYKNEFCDYFGHLFEAYVGRILRHCVESSCLFSDKQIRQVYKSPHGKSPDWIVVDGNRAILIECKAIRLNQKALATGDEDEIRKSLGELRSGIIQLYEFREACKARRVEINALNLCNEFIPVLVTFGDIYFANSSLYDDLLNEGIEQGAAEMPRTILSIEQLELLQCYVSAGHSMGTILTRLEL